MGFHLVETRLAEGVFDWGQLPWPQLLAGGFFSFGCMDLARYGWNWLELFEHIGNDKQWGVCGRGLYELNWLEDMSALTENIKG